MKTVGKGSTCCKQWFACGNLPRPQRTLLANRATQGFTGLNLEEICNDEQASLAQKVI